MARTLDNCSLIKNFGFLKQRKPYLDALYKTAAEKQAELDAEHARQLELTNTSSKGGDNLDGD